MAEITGSAAVEWAQSRVLDTWSELAVALREPGLVETVNAAGTSILQALEAGSKVIFLGNGGSAAEASHLAAEFVGRCTHDRQPLPALALTDSTTITAVSNDYGFEAVFARGVRALGAPGDVLVAMSTSGGSPNVLAAMSAAQDRGMTTIAMTGRRGRHFAEMADHGLVAPSEYTARVQEVHLLWGHGWCEAVDAHWAAKAGEPAEPRVTSR